MNVNISKVIKQDIAIIFPYWEDEGGKDVKKRAKEWG